MRALSSIEDEAFCDLQPLTIFINNSALDSLQDIEYALGTLLRIYHNNLHFYHSAGRLIFQTIHAILCGVMVLEEQNNTLVIDLHLRRALMHV